MSRYKSNSTNVQKQVIVGNADTTILSGSSSMNDNIRLIQNIGSNNLYINLNSGSATEGDNGELLLEPADKHDFGYYQGEIHGIASTGGTTASVITV